MIIAVALSSILRAVFPKDASAFGWFMHAALPPSHLVDETSLTVRQWAWLLAWGLGMYALGLWLLLKRPLGED